MKQSLTFPLAMATAALLSIAIPVGQSRAQADNERSPATALAALDVAEGLEATLFASEPMMNSPSNIDIDHLGRVWVMDIVNYRSRTGTRPAGDRILILEDTDHDGRADKTHVFYQGNDINGGMGICVLGKRVIVSASPNIFVFTDEDGDLKADKKELLFTGIGEGSQHDHTAHAFVFGPDGKLYWNFGNVGKQLHDKNGKPVVDRAGHQVIDNGKPYRGGMVFRCNLDGSDFEVLGHNFRNNYEVAVDSFGIMWQSDNDDDGNRGVRINYVMDYGNFGYRDEMTGASWRTPRIGMHTEIPKRHWHLKDPGVVPNLLQTGGGSPTGILVYEGRLLPNVFHNQIIHCDAGPNIVRAYPAENDGAGYKARSINILHGVRDQWFRPSDVCVAPDGSLIVADWYDPGVGGHRMGDVEKGRLFRIAPPGTPYKVPTHDFSTAKGATAALESPNLATRYLAWTSLHKMQLQAEPALLRLFNRRLFESTPSPHLRARALWLLGKIKGRGEHYARLAAGDDDPNIRITAIRLARQLGPKLVADLLPRLILDGSAQVRRECALSLRDLPPETARTFWIDLALQHNGRDRWALEALGIAADGRWDAYLTDWLGRVGSRWNTPAGRDIIWRSRAHITPKYLATLIADPTVESNELPRYLRAFDFLTGQDKNQVLNDLAFSGKPKSKRNVLVAVEAMKRLEPFEISHRTGNEAVMLAVLDQIAGTADFVELIEKFGVEKRYASLPAIAISNPNTELGVKAVRVLLNRNAKTAIENALKNSDSVSVENMLTALGNLADARTVSMMMPIVRNSGKPLEVRRAAARAVSKSREGAMRLIVMAESNRLDPRLKQAVAAGLHASSNERVKQKALKLFPLPPAKNSKPLPPISAMLKRKGDVASGRIVFHTTGTCAKCHVVNGFGKEVGPNLSEIGRKLSRQAFYESILFPSAGISHNYETYVLQLENGDVVSGVIVSRSAQEIAIKGPDALTRTYKMSRVEEIKKQDVSLMPADMQKLLTAEDLVNVIEYMMTLKEAKKLTKASK